jgi:polyhydroxyalkanoate synthase
MSTRDDFEDALNRGTKAFGGISRLGRIRDEDVTIAQTPKDEAFRSDKVTLHHYRPLDGIEPATGPIVIVYSLIGRYTVIDLQEDRSLVRNLLARGSDVYVIDWGSPSRADRFLSVDDYVDGYLNDCVDHIRRDSGHESVTLLGICEGGVFAAAYAALYPEKVKNLILTVTPIDFHADAGDANAKGHGYINLWTRSLQPADIDDLVDTYGNLPGEVMASVFEMITPVRSLTKYNLDLFDIVGDDDKLMNFLRMEKWLGDRPHHPGEAAKQWLKELYHQNKLVRNEFRLSGRTVDLGAITMPVLNVFALGDHIVPAACSQALGPRVGTADYTEVPLPSGHIGVFVSAKVQGLLGEKIMSWLRERQ